MHNAIDAGWLSSAKRRPSVHFNDRPDEHDIDLLVIHSISLPPEKFGEHFIEDFFLGKLDANAHPYFQTIAGLRVSAHLLINRQGELTQFVPFHKRAWHAGVSSFEGREECNDYSIGIELEGSDAQPFTDAQYQALADVTHSLFATYPKLSSERITGHSDIAPGRKTDPGLYFDWVEYKQRLAELA